MVVKEDICSGGVVAEKEKLCGSKGHLALASATTSGRCPLVLRERR